MSSEIERLRKKNKNLRHEITSRARTESILRKRNKALSGEVRRLKQELERRVEAKK